MRLCRAGRTRRGEGPAGLFAGALLDLSRQRYIPPNLPHHERVPGWAQKLRPVEQSEEGGVTVVGWGRPGAGWREVLRRSWRAPLHLRAPGSLGLPVDACCRSSSLFPPVGQHREGAPCFSTRGIAGLGRARGGFWKLPSPLPSAPLCPPPLLACEAQNGSPGLRERRQMGVLGGDGIGKLR